MTDEARAPTFEQLEWQLQAAQRALREDKTAAAQANVRRIAVLLRASVLGLAQEALARAAADPLQVRIERLAADSRIADESCEDAKVRLAAEQTETALLLYSSRVEVALLRWMEYKAAVARAQQPRVARLGKRKGCTAAELAEFVKARPGLKLDAVQREAEEVFSIKYRTFYKRVAEAKKMNLLQ